MTKIDLEQIIEYAKKYDAHNGRPDGDFMGRDVVESILDFAEEDGIIDDSKAATLLDVLNRGYPRY